MRIRHVLCAAVVSMWGICGAADAVRAPVDIPPQTLDTALQRLAHERGLQVIYMSDPIDSVRTAGAHGDLTSEESLTELLRGTGLTYRYLDDRTVTIVRAPAIAAASTGAAADSTDATPPAVTIEGQRAAVEQQVRAFVSGITHRGDDNSLVRWRVPMCPLVAGLPHDQGEAFLTRLSVIAKSVGAPLGSRTCRPNFYVVFSPQPDSIVRIKSARAGASLASRSPVRVFYNAEIERPDGIPVSSYGTPNPPGTASTIVPASVSDTRIDLAAVLNLASVVVLVDPVQVHGLTIIQLADYVAMVGLTEIDANAELGTVRTILHLFSASAQPAPPGLSAWDESFLKSLYATRQSFRLQRSQIAHRMVGELAGTK